MSPYKSSPTVGHLHLGRCLLGAPSHIWGFWEPAPSPCLHFRALQLLSSRGAVGTAPPTAAALSHAGHCRWGQWGWNRQAHIFPPSRRRYAWGPTKPASSRDGPVAWAWLPSRRSKENWEGYLEPWWPHSLTTSPLPWAFLGFEDQGWASVQAGQWADVCRSGRRWVAS